MFNNLLNETKSFKYQTTLKVMFKKCRSTEIEFAAVYFNSATKTVINHKFSLDKSFQEIFTKLMTGLMKDLGGLVN